MRESFPENPEKVAQLVLAMTKDLIAEMESGSSPIDIMRSVSGLIYSVSTGLHLICRDGENSSHITAAMIMERIIEDAQFIFEDRKQGMN